MSVKAQINQLIKDNKVMVFSKSYCPYCVKAKDTLSTYKPSSYKVLELDGLSNADEYQDYLKEITGARSVPRVFIGGKFVGGGDQTVALHRAGELQKLLEEAGAL